MNSPNNPSQFEINSDIVVVADRLTMTKFLFLNRNVITLSALNLNFERNCLIETFHCENNEIILKITQIHYASAFVPHHFQKDTIAQVLFALRNQPIRSQTSNYNDQILKSIQT